MKKQIILFFVLALALSAVAQEKVNFVAIHPTDTKDDIIRKAANVVPTERQLQWQQLELTAFFHFGVNTYTGREWGDGKEDPKIFNPTQLDAEQWVKTMKDAGFKQVILTAKHHDGFCLWPTKTTEHSLKNSPWKDGKGDVVKEVADACKKHKVGFGVYLSPWDRNAACYGTDEYNRFFEKQLTELLTWYGQVDEVWFDGANGEGPNGKKQEYDFMSWYALIRKLQPQAVIAIMGPDVRWVGTETGVGRFTEWSVVPTDNMDMSAIAENSQQNDIYKPQGDMMGQDLGGREIISKAKGLVWYPAETDVSIRPGWFYHQKEDSKVKSAKKMMSIYLTSVGMNSVLLLNVPPTPEGLISKADQDSLRNFSALLKNTFRSNLAKGAVIKSSNGINEKAMLDGNYKTYFTTKDKDITTTSTINITLKGRKTFNLLSLQENIAVGQRVEKFTAEYQNKAGKWVQFTEGTTIGYKRILKFDTITAQKIRVNILSSRLNPTVSELGIYLMK